MTDPEISVLLARLAEGRLLPGEADVLCAALAHEASLTDALSSLLEIQGIECAGGLAMPAPEELSAAAAQLFAVVNIAGNDVGMPEPLVPDAGQTEEDSVRNAEAVASRWDGEEAQTMTPTPSQRQQAIDHLFGSADAEAASDIVGKPGEPDLFSLNVRQEFMDNCVLKTEQLILQEFGIEVSAEELARLAYENGWYTPGIGVGVDDVGRLLEAHGIEVTHYSNANIFNLVSELAQGRQVIIAVDSGELWHSNDVVRDLLDRHPELFEDGIADHAVIVSGVEISDPNNPVVVISDPGTGQIAAEYPLADFLDAWEDSGFRMVATNVSPEQFAAAHVNCIGEIPYATFEALYPNLAGLTGFEAFFDRTCEVFRHHLYQPIPQGATDLSQLLPFPSLPGTPLSPDVGALLVPDLQIGPNLQAEHDADADADSDGLS